MECKCGNSMYLVDDMPSRMGYIEVYRCPRCQEVRIIEIEDDDYEYDEDDMSEFYCLDCGVDTSYDGIDEYYMVRNSLWYDANPKVEGMLCIDCLESRIGRKLNRNDFTNAQINSPDETTSKRLLNRLGYV